MMPHPVAYLIIAVYCVIILCCDLMLLSVIFFDHYSILDIVNPVVIVIAGVLSAALVFDFLIRDRPIPGFTPFSGDDLKQRNDHEHSADANSDKQRLRIFHFGAGFAVYEKACYGDDSQNNGKNGRPPVGIFDVFCKGRIIDF